MTMRAFSTIEIMLSLMILATISTGVFIATINAPLSIIDSIRRREATEMAARALNKELEPGSTFADVTTTTSTTNGEFISSLSVILLPDALTKKLTSVVSWTDAKGRFETVSLPAFITDTNKMSSTLCSDVLSNDWHHPMQTSFSFTPGSLLPLTLSTSSHPISTLAVSNSLLAAGVTTARDRNDDTLFLFSISSTTPLYEGSIDNASSTIQGINAVALDGNYAFAANAAQPDFTTCRIGPSCSQLQIFDLSNPSSPLHLSDYQLSTTAPPFAIGSNGQAIGKSIAYRDNMIYLGLSKTGSPSGEEFNVIDVHDPSAPQWLGGFTIGRSINRILIQEPYAYLATDDPDQELIVLDVHDPTHITQVASHNAPGADDFGYARDIALTGTTMLLGRTYSPNAPEFSLLSVSSSSPPAFTLLSDALRMLSVNAVLVRNYIAFVLTDSALILFDISNPLHPQPEATSTLPAGTSGTAIACRGNVVYVSSVDGNQNGYLSLITAS